MSSDVFVEPHHLTIAPIRKVAHKRLNEKLAAGKPKRFSKREAVELADNIKKSEQRHIYNDVNFSRAQIDHILAYNRAGVLIEFETLGPYLLDYIASEGVIAADTLTPEDKIGLELARLFRDLFPQGRLVSLYDDYNVVKVSQQSMSKDVAFTSDRKQRFFNSLVQLFKDAGVILPKHKTPRDFRLISESSRQDEAVKLVGLLDERGYIEHRGEAILFSNDDAENPLHREFILRTKTGRWLCEALDAATFLDIENLSIVHIVVLPDYMRDQQDKVWEILRVLGVQPGRYHNIFFNPTASPQTVRDSVATVFNSF